MECTIDIKGLDKLAESIALLAQALSGQRVSLPNTELTQQSLPGQMPVASTQPTNQVYVQPQPTPTMQQPIIINSQQQTAPPPITPPVQQTMPTTHVAQAFTIEQIQLAMSGLVDAGKMTIVTEIMRSFNVAAITQIAKEQYPAVVAKLREGGAQI